VISVERELAALDMFQSDFVARMAAAKGEHPSAEIAGTVARLTELLMGRVGDRWPAERLNSLRKEGEDRYSKKIPPGYKDAKKDAGEYDKFGDLIIWKDMIAKAKADKRPVVFISDDAKEDWWWTYRGRKLGPRPELVDEFRVCSDQDFHIYEFTQFLRIAADRHPEIQEGVEEVEKSLLDDEKARKHQQHAARQREINARIVVLEDERDQIVAALSGAPMLDKTKLSSDRAELRRRLEALNAELASLAPSAAENIATPEEESESP
jgi:hypothetical protein